MASRRFLKGLPAGSPSGAGLMAAATSLPGADDPGAEHFRGWVSPPVWSS